MKSTNARPDQEFRAGSLFAAIWKEPRKAGNGEGLVHSIRIQKRYRDERTGQWKSTTYLRPEDLPKLALLANRIYEHIYLRDQRYLATPASQVTAQKAG